MTEQLPISSDDARTNAPLKYAKTETFEGPIALERGDHLPKVEVVYETYGQLNAVKDNAVMVCHALTGDSHIVAHDENDDPGWWEIMVGPGKPIDTDKYFVICSNVLGSCRGTTGPGSINPATNKPYGKDFPLITIGDMVDVQKRLLDRLEIEKLFAVVGASLGGHQALCWATKYPDRVGAIAAIATGPTLTSQALAFDVVGRNAITLDPNFHDGQYYDKETKPNTGLAIARMLGHITYLSRESMRDKFDNNRLEPRAVDTEFEKHFSISSYLAYQGDKFVERFDANSYVVISLAMDHFNLGNTHEQLAESIGKSGCRWLIMSFSSDWLFPPFQAKQMRNALISRGKYVSYCNIKSDCGHDAFLLPNEFERYGGIVRGFLDTTTVDATFADVDVNQLPQDVKSIFHNKRLDYDQICGLIEKNSSVLDLGCGQGGLLMQLARQREASRLVGIELDEANLQAAIQLGFDVIQSDLEKGVPMFGNGEFDYVVLSQTLQSVVHTEQLVEQMVRIGKKCIVSFPNFAYKDLRNELYHEGVSPGTEHGQLSFEWFNTPNRRFLSIKDWEDFCKQKGVVIHDAVCLNSETGERVADDPNLNADLAIYVISK
ncbi:Homoserine O-acetyltransferase [Poriferisphaera corsica]|uniref:Homoserine O-acetyltransferase n=1 Tax=Poriferisphaera corsica TaxID=2528020 RepID=A0A517YRS9_9BACT|nr:homoserine O-acetyltransferase [Poriferisphaera corsica]QDU32929.1 Homoserine O-acetyltransferase [Poriferisphaera corsica]